MSTGEFILQVMPLALLLLFVVVVVWRGMKRAPDGSKNKRNIGGGPGSDP